MFDENDLLLMEMDNVLCFSDQKKLYTVEIKKENIEIACISWKDMSENIIKFKQKGIQKNGFVYIKNKNKEGYEMEYKIVLNGITKYFVERVLNFQNRTVYLS